MRSSLLLSVPLGLLTLACTPSGGTGPTGSPVIPQDGGIAPQQDTETCTGDTTKCLSGTAQTKSLAAPQAYFASLYTMLPLGGAAPVAQQQVARDGTWAFSNLSEGEHYYVQIAAVYGEGADGGGGNAIGATVGPLAVPASGSTQAVVVKPVQLTVEQSATSGGALELVSALAYVFDPTTGAPSTGNDTVTIGVGGTQVPMPWTAIAPNVYAYSATFTSPTPAQSTYTITTSSSASWQLVANTPSFTPSITAPASGATVPSGTDLLVSWAPQPTADEELVLLYDQTTDGGPWTAVNPSAAPLPSSTTQATLPGSEIVAGPLLVDAEFLVGSCPLTADGCVISEAIASSQITAQ